MVENKKGYEINKCYILILPLLLNLFSIISGVFKSLFDLIFSQSFFFL